MECPPGQDGPAWAGSRESARQYFHYLTRTPGPSRTSHTHVEIPNMSLRGALIYIVVMILDVAVVLLWWWIRRAERMRMKRSLRAVVGRESTPS